MRGGVESVGRTCTAAARGRRGRAGEEGTCAAMVTVRKCQWQRRERDDDVHGSVKREKGARTSAASMVRRACQCRRRAEQLMRCRQCPRRRQSR